MSSPSQVNQFALDLSLFAILFWLVLLHWFTDTVCAMSLITGVSSHTASTLRAANARFLHTASKEGLRVIASGMERAVRECDAHQGTGPGRAIKPSKTHRTTHYSTPRLIFWLALIFSFSYDMMPLMCLSSVSLQRSSWIRVNMYVCTIVSGFIGALTLSKEDLASRGLSTADVFFSKVTNDIILYCTVLYCTVLYCTVLYCTVLYCTVLYCTVLNCTVLYCTVLYCTVLHLYHRFDLSNICLVAASLNCLCWFYDDRSPGCPMACSLFLLLWKHRATALQPEVSYCQPRTVWSATSSLPCKPPKDRGQVQGRGWGWGQGLGWKMLDRELQHQHSCAMTM